MTVVTRVQRPVMATFYEMLPLADPRLRRQLDKYREGKRTVALVGFSPLSVSLAPWWNEDVELWGLNEVHLLPFCNRWDRWFQMHRPDYYQRDVDLRGNPGHYDWLQKEHGDRPIYMQQAYPDVPNAVRYPKENALSLLGSIRVGMEKIKLFNSTFDYMIALAIYEGYERIEMYGFEWRDNYASQRNSGHFWIGMAASRAEIYMPETVPIFDTNGLMYGYSFNTAAKDAALVEAEKLADSQN